jgi:2-polyprenyl-3-methyl-5-hydroxy-6-metoxy-1,4-benzoquinol methylase
MLHYKKGKLVAGREMGDFEYIKGRGLLARMVLPNTRRLRFTNAMRYCVPGASHLDIGCGDGYFLRRSPCEEAIGIDMRLGDSPVESSHPLPFENGRFDLVTMLAVLEHLTEPRFVIEDIARVLRPRGRLVLTTPKKSADKLIRIYVKDLDDEHETYFEEMSMKKLVEGVLRPVGYHSFLLGLNQAFAAEKE